MSPWYVVVGGCALLVGVGCSSDEASGTTDAPAIPTSTEAEPRS